MTSTLADLENKLRHLEQTLSSIAADAVEPEIQEPDIQEPVQEHTPVDPPSEPAVLADEQPQSPGPHLFAEPIPVVSEAEELSPPVSVGDESAARVVDEALEPEPSDSAPTLDPERLLAFRDRLEDFAQQLLVELDELISQLGGAPQLRAPEPPSEEPSPPSSHDDVLVDYPQHTPDEPTATQQMHAGVPTAELTEYEGHVELGVGPFFDIGSLSAFESRLAEVPNIAETAVRRFEASHAVLDLRLSGPVTLIGELHAIVDGDFSVRQISENRIAINFEDS